MEIGMNDTVRGNKNVIQTASGTIASMGLDKLGKGAAGVAVTPAVWVLNYGVDGSKPSSVDAGIYASGFLSAGAATVVGLFKSVVDDDMARKLERAKQHELPKYRPFIKNCYGFSHAPALINAQHIASQGGTAWQSASGLWVYITDAKGKMIADYKPRSAVVTYQPKFPFQRRGNKFIWGAIR